MSKWREAAELIGQECACCPAIQRAFTGHAWGYISDPCAEVTRFTKMFKPDDAWRGQAWFGQDDEARVVALLLMELIEADE
jgi:hypothetical protein